jgi:hypothetical protein
VRVSDSYVQQTATAVSNDLTSDNANGDLGRQIFKEGHHVRRHFAAGNRQCPIDVKESENARIAGVRHGKVRIEQQTRQQKGSIVGDDEDSICTVLSRCRFVGTIFPRMEMDRLANFRIVEESYTAINTITCLTIVHSARAAKRAPNRRKRQGARGMNYRETGNTFTSAADGLFL